MSTRVAFDNNFLDAFAAADDATREAVFRCVELGHLEMFATYEMLREVMGLALTARKDKIIPFSKDILRLTKGKILATTADAQESDPLQRHASDGGHHDDSESCELSARHANRCLVSSRQ